MDVATLAELLRETAQHHDHYEKTHPKHNWWDWYAPYLSARQNGSTPEEAAAAADRYMERKLAKEKCRWLSSHEASPVGAAPQM
jgi:hypothetical protein